MCEHSHTGCVKVGLWDVFLIQVLGAVRCKNLNLQNKFCIIHHSIIDHLFPLHLVPFFDYCEITAPLGGVAFASVYSVSIFAGLFTNRTWCVRKVILEGWEEMFFLGSKQGDVPEASQHALFPLLSYVSRSRGEDKGHLPAAAPPVAAMVCLTRSSLF